MTEDYFRNINWKASLAGFCVDWAFTELVGVVVFIVLIAVNESSFESVQDIPTGVTLGLQSIGVVGAILGGAVAGYIARERGALHGVLGSLIGLPVSFCLIGLTFDLGDVGFLVLNLIGAGYGGRFGERWRRRRERET